MDMASVVAFVFLHMYLASLFHPPLHHHLSLRVSSPLSSIGPPTSLVWWPPPSYISAYTSTATIACVSPCLSPSRWQKGLLDCFQQTRDTQTKNTQPDIIAASRWRLPSTDYSSMPIPTLNMERSIWRGERDYLDLGYVRRQRLFGIRACDVLETWIVPEDLFFRMWDVLGALLDSALLMVMLASVLFFVLSVPLKNEWGHVRFY